MTRRQVADPEELADFYGADRELHIYALADLEEPYWSASTWWRDGDAVVGLITLPDGEGDLVYAVSSRDSHGTVELLDSLVDEMEPGVLITGPRGMGAMLSKRTRLAWNRQYHRFVLVAARAADDPAPDVVELDAADANELEDLYGRDAGAAFFRPSMLRHGTFAGVRREGRLVAVAGTHVMSDRQRVAAIGAVVTDPAWRGNGLAREATLGVLRRLEGRVDVIGLNCADRNTAGRRLWKGLGFEPRLGYEEGAFA